MSCLICNELLHDTITYGLIPVYLTLNTISPPKVITQLPKPNKDLSATSMVVIAAIVIEREEGACIQSIVTDILCQQSSDRLKNMISASTKTTLRPPDYFPQATTLLRRPQDYYDNRFPSWRHPTQ
jgi:hypothetical protein